MRSNNQRIKWMVRPVKALGSLMQWEWNPRSQTLHIISSTSCWSQIWHFLQLGHSQCKLSLILLSICGEQFRQLMACPDIPHREQVISSLSPSPALPHIPHLGCDCCDCFCDDFCGLYEDTIGWDVGSTTNGLDMSSTKISADDGVMWGLAITDWIDSSILSREEVGFGIEGGFGVGFWIGLSSVKIFFFSIKREINWKHLWKSGKYCEA